MEGVTEIFLPEENSLEGGAIDDTAFVVNGYTKWVYRPAWILRYVSDENGTNAMQNSIDECYDECQV